MSSNLDVGMKCIKYMIFVTNFMFVMIGFLLISVGSTVGAIYGEFDIFMESHFFRPSALLVAIGVIIFFVSLFGCLGAVKESVFLVNIYSILLALVLILEIAAAIAGYGLKSNIERNIEENMNRTMVEYKNVEYFAESWDFLQDRFQCCGIHSPSDWNRTRPIYNESGSYLGPESCCYLRNCNEIYQTGCLDRLVYITKECAVLVGTGAICVALVQALGVIFANMLAKSIRRLKTEQEIKRQESRQRLYAQLARGNEDKPTPVLYAAPNTKA